MAHSETIMMRGRSFLFDFRTGTISSSGMGSGFAQNGRAGGVYFSTGLGWGREGREVEAYRRGLSTGTAESRTFP